MYRTIQFIRDQIIMNVGHELYRQLQQAYDYFNNRALSKPYAPNS
jgi:hypothetical protein